LELLDQPANKIPKTLKEDKLKKKIKFNISSKYPEEYEKDIKFKSIKLIKKHIKGAKIKK